MGAPRGSPRGPSKTERANGLAVCEVPARIRQRRPLRPSLISASGAHATPESRSAVQATAPPAKPHGRTTPAATNPATTSTRATRAAPIGAPRPAVSSKAARVISNHGSGDAGFALQRTQVDGSAALHPAEKASSRHGSGTASRAGLISGDTEQKRPPQAPATCEDVRGMPAARAAALRFPPLTRSSACAAWGVSPSGRTGRSRRSARSMSSASILPGRRAASAARHRTFRSSRTLPGQSCPASRPSAPEVNVRVPTCGAS